MTETATEDTYHFTTFVERSDAYYMISGEGCVRFFMHTDGTWIMKFYPHDGVFVLCGLDGRLAY